MKIALSFQDGKTISGHAGRCTKFLVYDIQENNYVSRSILEIDEERTIHNVLHDLMLPFMDHPIFNMDVIISNSMCNGFIKKMRIKGIEAVPTEEVEPDRAVQMYLSGELEALMPEK